MSQIVFPSLPDSARVPMMYTEFDPTGASDDASLMPYTVLVVGQMLGAGKAQPYTPYRPMSKKAGDELFGQGSQAASMVAAYLNANNLTKMLAIAAPDFDGGVQAEGAVALSGSVVNSAPLCLYIGGTRVRVAANYGDTAGDVAERLAAAINADADFPVTARNEINVVTLKARHKGECGNDIDLRLSYQDEPVPGGLAITITALGGGAGNPDTAEIIAGMGNDRYHLIAWPWTDNASLSILKAELDDRWGPIRQKDGQAIVVKTGSFGQVTTFAGARNDKHLTVYASEGSPTLPWVDCAATMGVIAYYGNQQPARQFRTLPVPGVLAPHPSDIWPDYPEKNQGLFEGVSTRYVAPDGTLRLQKAITTYRLSDLGAEDKAFLSLHSPLTLSYLRFDWNNFMLRKYPRHMLAGDADAIRYVGKPVMTPKLGRAEAVSRCGLWVDMCLVEGLEQFKRDLVVARNDRNENRLDFLFRPNLMNNFEVGGTLIRHLV